MRASIAAGRRSAGVQATEAAALRAWPSDTRDETRLKERQFLSAGAFLVSAGVTTKVVDYESRVTIYTQGDPAASVLYIQKSCVKRAVSNESGKEIVVAISGLGDFFGESCLARQARRASTVATITLSAIQGIQISERSRLLRSDKAFSDRFINYVLSRKIRVEANLIDQLFNSTEKYLARTLLMLARYGASGQPQKVLPEISQETLAEIIGTTRARVNFFMNKFRSLGFLDHSELIHINNSLLSAVLGG